MPHNCQDHIPDPLPADATCPKCGKKCEAETIDGRFGYSYGAIEDIAGRVEIVSDCCGVVLRASDFSY
jgi:hypothetical protein